MCTHTITPFIIIILFTLVDKTFFVDVPEKSMSSPKHEIDRKTREKVKLQKQLILIATHNDYVVITIN